MKKTELTYSQVKKLSEALMAIGTLNFKGAPLDFLISISKNQVSLEDHIKVFQDTSDKLAKKFAEKNDDGNPVVKGMQIQISDDNYVKFDKEMSDLLKKTVTVEIDVLPRSYFTDEENGTPDGVTANIIKSLMPILEL